ncbi:hypothetical protein ACFO1B_12975 [Dactylosporangium siamense]|uniref:Uncharacterized protein n=1 Tax=Dactylosporangium siamense TaxID=685454 RepID=A0A919UG14_9ACTN|nr:hypothetical protein [Dactylosporangium siamense]GIG49198.1 hypothetical protein Dsi01nite_072390 [Dactylosporangium siamense]
MSRVAHAQRTAEDLPARRTRPGMPSFLPGPAPRGAPRHPMLLVGLAVAALVLCSVLLLAAYLLRVWFSG